MRNNFKGKCWLCGTYGPTETHHIFEGPNRKWSDKYGLTVELCMWCHREGKNAAHLSRDTADYLHVEGQKAFEKTYGSREDFMKIFGRNYL